MSERIYRVSGMGCANCERAVMQEVSLVTGVASVGIDREARFVVVRGDGLSDDELRAAIGDAGYEAVAA